MNEKMPISKNNREELTKEFNKKLEIVQKGAISENEFNKRKELKIKKINNILTDKEKNELNLLNEKMENNEILMQTLEEFNIGLQIVFTDKERIQRAIAHENAHANVAQQLPSQEFLGYRIRCIKKPDGDYTYKVSVKVDTLDSFSQQQILRESIMVCEAPEKYGERLSEKDKIQIQALRKKLEEIE